MPRPFENLPARPLAQYHLVEHIDTGELFALRTAPETNHVTGCLPIHRLVWRCTDLTALPYDADLELIEWADGEWWGGRFDLTG